MDPEVTGDASAAVDEDLCLEVVSQKPSDFDSWVSLISDVEKLYDDDKEKICSIYDSFLSEFPLCYGYWRKYVGHMIRLSTFDKVIQVFEQAVLAVTHSVDVWLDYCVFCMSLFPDPKDVRRQFKRGLAYVGRDYSCYNLWDKYIEFEFSQQNWSGLAYIYIQILRHPKKMLCDYYDRFTQLVAMFKDEMERQGTFAIEIDSMLANELPTVHMDDEILGIINDLLDECDNLSKTKAWHKYKSIGVSLYKKSCLLDEKICCFEVQIHRTYFHMKPLNKKELENWHQYLDFVEEQGDFDWAVKLYERCLVPCAQYTDFWIRYVQFLENDGGRELANFALDRATKTFVKSVPSIHLFNARYKEKTRDFNGARAAFPKFDREVLHPNFLSNVMKQANMERRLGNYEGAYRIYREAIELATERDEMNVLSCLYIYYSQLTYKATNSVGAALGILADGIKQNPCGKLLLKEFIKFGMMHGDPEDMNVVHSIVANALTSKEPHSFSSKEKESMSLYFLKFVDLCGTISDLMRAWARHIKLFPDSVRPAFNEPPCGGELAELAVSKATDLCTNVDTSMCSASCRDGPDRLLFENQTEPRSQKRSDDREYALDELGNGSVPSPNKIVGNASADLSLQDNHTIDAMRNVKDPTKLSDIQHEDDHGDEHILKSISFEGISMRDKGPPNATITMDYRRNLENVSKKITEENIPIAKCDSSLPNSLQDHWLSETHVGASSDSGQSVRGTRHPSKNERNLLQRSPSPAGTPKSVSSYVQKASEDPPSACNESSTQNFVGNPESARDWHFRRRPDRFIKDPTSKYRPNRQRRTSPPRNFRSDSDHIITIQHNATQSLNMNTQPVQNNSAQYQQSWASTPSSAAMPYLWPVQNVQQNITSASQSQVPLQPVDQASAQMPHYTVQAGNQTEQMQNQQAYNQMMQNYYYQQQVLLQQQIHLQQFQLAPDQWQQQQQQQYWMQLQYQQQLAQAPTQQLTQQMPMPMQLQVQAPLQMQQQAQVPIQMQQQAQAPIQLQQQTQAPIKMQQRAQAPFQMQQQAQAPLQNQQQAQAPLQMQQQAEPESQAPLLHQQQLQQLLELQQQRKQHQQQLEHQQAQQQSQPQPQQEKVQVLHLRVPTSSENSA